MPPIRLGRHPGGVEPVYGAVNGFRDLDSTLIGAVERLIDFVTIPEVSKSDLM